MLKNIRMLKTLKLGVKFNILLIIAFFGAVIISGVALSKALYQRVTDEVTLQAKLLIETLTAVRTYTDQHITPLLTPQINTNDNFLPEFVPAYSAITVFENVRENPNYKGFFYKEATLNPTNLRDKADSFETQIIERFRQEPGTKEISGFPTLPFGKIFYIAHPLTVIPIS